MLLHTQEAHNCFIRDPTMVLVMLMLYKPLSKGATEEEPLLPLGYRTLCLGLSMRLLCPLHVG